MKKNAVPNLRSTKTVKQLAWGGLVLLAAFGICGGMSFGSLKTQYSVLQFLPSHHPALEMDRAIRDHFHLVDRPTFIGLVTLSDGVRGGWLNAEHMRKLGEFCKKVQKLSGVHDVVSLANIKGLGGDDSSINVGEIVGLTPEAKWPERILGDKLLAPALISKDARSVLIYAELEEPNVELMITFETEMKALLASEFPGYQTRLGGVPAVQSELSLLLNKELRNFLLFTILACAITLMLVFRTLSTVAIPLILTGFANVMVIAGMAWTGLAFTILSSTIPIFVFITVVSMAAHTLLRFHEDASDKVTSISKWQLIRRTHRAVWLPNLLGALTTIVGFLTLLTSEVPLIRNYGLAVAGAVMLSWFFTSIGILPFMILFPIPRPRVWVNRPARWALGAIALRKYVVAAVLTGCMVLGFVGRRLDWKGRLFDDLPSGQEARESTENIDRTMGGVLPLEMEVKMAKAEAWKDPVNVAKLDHLVELLRDLPGVGSAQSIPEFLRASAPGFNRALPSTLKAIAETYFLYSFSPENPLTDYLVEQNRTIRIGFKLHDLPSDQILQLLTLLQKRVQDAFPDSKIEIGGLGAYVHAINNELSNDLIFGFWQALLLIVVMLAFVFRSLRWALIACIPNLVPPIALLGFLALTHTPVKPGVAIIFSIALGLAFNNTVYLLNRLRQIQQARLSGVPARAISRTFYLEGNPCLVSTLIILMGFSVFLFSYFPLNQTFGACMIVSILAGLIGDLIFLPALLGFFPHLLANQAKLGDKPKSPIDWPKPKGGEEIWERRKAA